MFSLDHKKQLDAVLNSVIDAIITIDTTGIILSFNVSAEKMFGLHAIEVLGKKVNLLMPEPYHSNHDQYLSNYLETGRKRVLGIGREAVGRRQDGTIFPIDLAVTEVVESGEHYFLGVIRDITEKKAARKNLLATLDEVRRSREDFLNVLNQLRQGVVMFDSDGTTTFLNDAALQIFCKDQQECIGRPWADIFPYDKPSIKNLKHLLSVEAGPGKITITNRAVDGFPICHEFEVLRTTSEQAGKCFLISDLTDMYTLRQLLDERNVFHRLIGKSQVMLNLFQNITELAKVKITVLIEGETGTGKELVARALHDLSERNDKAFIAVNCAGLIDSLIASQLFGHRKGAFTGATHDQKGFFEAADNGTLFLDEIGDISLDLQKALLRVLQEKEYTKIGETVPRKVDVRIITASHRNLEQEVRKGTFRQDLLYRIRVATLKIPPLRQRLEDIPLLANFFLRNCSIATGKQVNEITGEAMRMLMTYTWPGNIRELQNAIEVATVSCPGSTLRLSDFPEFVFPRQTLNQVETIISGTERDQLLALLADCRGKKAAAAKILGISRSTMYRRLKEYGLL